MKRFVVYLFIPWITAGCVAQHPLQLLDGTTSTGAPVCLNERERIPSFFERFYSTRDLTTEEGKIDYLLERIRTSDLKIIRNGVEFENYLAAQFLRWKLDRFRSRHKIAIKTVDDFIAQVTNGSRISGLPYAVDIPGAGRHNLQRVLENELDMLNQCLAQEQERKEAELKLLEAQKIAQEVERLAQASSPAALP